MDAIKVENRHDTKVMISPIRCASVAVIKSPVSRYSLAHAKPINRAISVRRRRRPDDSCLLREKMGYVVGCVRRFLQSLIGDMSAVNATLCISPHGPFVGPSLSGARLGK